MESLSAQHLPCTSPVEDYCTSPPCRSAAGGGGIGLYWSPGRCPPARGWITGVEGGGGGSVTASPREAVIRQEHGDRLRLALLSKLFYQTKPFLAPLFKQPDPHLPPPTSSSLCLRLNLWQVYIYPLFFSFFVSLFLQQLRIRDKDFVNAASK